MYAFQPNLTIKQHPVVYSVIYLRCGLYAVSQQHEHSLHDFPCLHIV